MYKLTLTANGARVTSYPDRGNAGGTRGKVSGMSDGAKRRFMWLLNSVLFDCLDFVTLTYRENVTDTDRAYRDLRRFHKGLQRAVGETGIIWRREVQKRGAYHFHLFVVNRSLKRAVYRDAWLDATDGAGDLARRRYGVHVKSVDNLLGKDAGVIISYMAKYSAKDGAGEGRQWGILGRKQLEFFSYEWELTAEEYETTKSKLHEMGSTTKEFSFANTETTQRYFGGAGKVSPRISEFIPKR